VSSLPEYVVITIYAVGLVLLPMRLPLAAQSSVASGKFRIAGTVVSANDGHQLAQARVSIFDTRNPSSPESVLTAEDGHFEFTHLRAGKYALNGAKRGYISADYDHHEQFSTAIVTGSGLDTESLILRLAPAAVLSGKVLDEAGEPVRHAIVLLWREDHSSGVSRIARSRGDSTDDLGFYEFTGLDDGTYFLSASGQPWYAVHPVSAHQTGSENALTLVDRSLDVAYPTTYYGGASEWEDATPIPVRGGERLEVDIHLAPVPALHVLFHSMENSDKEISPPFLQKQGLEGPGSRAGFETQMVSPGLFEITGLVPGKYIVRFSASGQQGDQVSEIDLTRDAQELDTSAAVPLSNVDASVEVQGEAKLPQGLEVALRDARRQVVAWQRVNDKREVRFAGIAPGKYEVRAGSPSKAYSVVRVSSQNGQTSGHTLNVAPGAELKVTFTLIGGSVNVEGFVKRQGKPAPGAMVVLVPDDPDSNRERFRRDQSDLDGSFRLQSVIAGTYSVVAIGNGWDLDWAQPAVIESYARHGTKITIGAKGETSVHLSESIELQPR
jgi:hypothetical protein